MLTCSPYRFPALCMLVWLLLLASAACGETAPAASFTPRPAPTEPASPAATPTPMPTFPTTMPTPLPGQLLAAAPTATPASTATLHLHPAIQNASQGHLPRLTPPTLEERILLSDAIARASLVSVTAGAQEDARTSQGYVGTQELRFRVAEYLHGTGANDITVVVPLGHYRYDHHGYLSHPTRALALEAAKASLQTRNAAWDDREGILFLELPDSANAAISPAAVFRFPLPLWGAFHDFVSTFPPAPTEWEPWEYSIDTLNQVWLPAEERASGEAVGGQSASPDSLRFITGLAPASAGITGTASAQTISFAHLRSRIAAFNADMDAGKEVCVRNKIRLDRWLREYEAREGRPWAATPFQHRIASGARKGTVIIARDNLNGSLEYHNFWVGGPDHSLFESLIVDEDGDSSTRYGVAHVTKRPLPAGIYDFTSHIQLYDEIPCGYKPPRPYVHRQVTVTAPTGTVHEAFFDLGTSAAGVPDPAGFTAGGVSTVVQRLEWRNGAVVLTLSPYAALTGHALDFIALDGSVALSLDAGAAAVGSASGTLTWTVASQPWRDGDQLMLRIRKGGAFPTLTPTPTPTASLTPEPTANPMAKATATATPLTMPTATATPTPTAVPAATTSPSADGAGAGRGDGLLWLWLILAALAIAALIAALAYTGRR